MQDVETNIALRCGILASISWHSHKWASEPLAADLKNSHYGYVQERAIMHESLNFGHDIFPTEPDGYYIGYTPMFNRVPATKNLQIVFFVSSDYHHANQKSIVGFYGFPTIAQKFLKMAAHVLYATYKVGNIKAHREHIIYFDCPIIINNDIAQAEGFLPIGKKISQQSFNYLTLENVQKLLAKAQTLNPTNQKLMDFISTFPAVVAKNKEAIAVKNWQTFIGSLSADNVKDIAKMEQKMKTLSPELRQRVSAFIERGTIAKQVKKLTHYKCLVCEALGQAAHSFLKPNGEYYIETHHVEPVSTLKTGVLGLSNLITVCANHHRQLHYGKVDLVENTDSHFKFCIDDALLTIRKISVT